MTDLAALRRQYGRTQLRREDLDADPIAQFRKWIGEATALDLVDANAMSLATVSKAGEPSIRTVLLKGFDERGFLFFTNLESRKATEIADNPHVALLFYWREFERQINVRGTASRLSIADVTRYFVTRPRDSNFAALASPQSRVITARQVIEAKIQELKRKIGDGEIPLPSFWGGFRVRPDTIEFWQGGKDRLHDRFQYSRDAGGWRIDQLAP